MARHNIVFGRDQAVRGDANFNAPRFGQSAQNGPAPDTQWSSGFGQPQGGQQFGAPQNGAPQHGAPQHGGDSLESMYARPSATGHDTGRMTMKDALNAITATLGIVVVVGAFVALLPYAGALLAGPAGAQAGLGAATLALIVGGIGGLILGLINAFTKQPSPVLVILYALFQGLFVGGASGTMEAVYPGIVLQAVGGTLAVAGTVLVLFRLGVLRTSPRLNKIFLVAMIAYTIFVVANLALMLLTGGNMRDGLLGLVIGALAVVMASYSLVMDFEDVQHATEMGAPRRYAWRVAFGLAVTLVWMYIEILRILAILRGND